MEMTEKRKNLAIRCRTACTDNLRAYIHYNSLVLQYQGALDVIEAKMREKFL